MTSIRRNTLYGILEKDHKAIFENINRFCDVLEKLRYEGKNGLGKNLADAGRLVAYLRREIISHMLEEEKTLFPFICAHIPRLEPMVCLLLSEHDDFRRCAKDLKRSVQACRRSRSAESIQTLCQRGTYAACLLRNHMWCESHSLYKAAAGELRKDEKRKVLKLIRRVKRAKGSRKRRVS